MLVRSQLPDMIRGLGGVRQICVCHICVCLFLLLPAGESRAQDWPRFLNSDFSGSVDRAGDIDRDWSKSPECLWSMELGDGYGLGVVVDNHYFHFDAVSGLERLQKISLASGKVIWSQTYPLNYRDLYGYETGPRSSPTIASPTIDRRAGGAGGAGDQIFTLGVSGVLTARSTEDGSPLWQVDTNTKFSVVQNFFGSGSAPLVWDDLVIAMVGGSPPADQEIAPGRLDRVSPNGSLAVAFDRETGVQRWQCGDDLASYSSPRTMQIDGETYVLMFARDHLHLINPRDGESIGRVRYRADILESVNAMTPVVMGTRVMIADCYDLGAAVFNVSVVDGKAVFDPVWRDPEANRRNQAMRSHLSTPVLHDGFLYACSGRNAPDSDFRCVEFATGKVQWDDALSRRRSTATRIGEVLLILKETGPLHIARCTPQKYDELGVWSLDESTKGRPSIGFPCWAAPLVVGDRVLVRGDKTLLCLRLPE